MTRKEQQGLIAACEANGIEFLRADCGAWGWRTKSDDPNNLFNLNVVGNSRGPKWKAAADCLAYCGFEN